MHRNKPTSAVDVPLLDSLILHRLLDRQIDGESFDEVIERLLDATVEEVPIESVVDDIFAHYDHVAGIGVMVTDNENPSWAHIVVSTADVPDIEEPAPLYRSGRYRLTVGNAGDVQCSIPFLITAEPYGPMFETIGTTPIFIDGEIALDDGLDRLRSKLGRSADELGDEIWGQQLETN